MFTDAAIVAGKRRPARNQLTMATRIASPASQPNTTIAWGRAH
jgi:hypothetical protein